MASGAFASRAFSLLELVIVVLIIGIIGAIAIPRLSALAVSAEYNAVGEQLNHFETAFTLYKHDNGDWPGDRARGVVPPEMVSGGYLKPTDFDEQPLGGAYDWQHWGAGDSGPQGAYIGISAPTDIEGLANVDAIIDDGDLTTGNFYRHSSKWSLLALER